MLAGLTSTTFAMGPNTYAGDNGYDGLGNPDCPNTVCPN